MLPDFPEIKNKLRILSDKLLQKRKNIHLGILSEIPSTTIDEGKKWKVVREDGSITVQVFKTLKVERQIDLSGIESLTDKEIFKKIDDVGKEFAQKQAKFMFAQLKDAAEESGNVLKIKNRKLNMNDYLDLLEKVDFSFNKNGDYKLPKLVGGDPNLYSDLLEGSSDPTLKKRFDEIIEKKRDKWRDREINRKLAD